MVADALIWEAVKKSAVVREGASEEDPIVRDVDEGGEGEFTVCWDPLDGSSIVDSKSREALGSVLAEKLIKNFVR